MNADIKPNDHAARAAALDPGRSFLVQAPAGSGKTELLTDRILALLPTVKRPEEIIAITFTRKAAAEMHARVMEKLAMANGPAPEQGHARASWELARQALAHDAAHDWQLLQFPARLTIQTIDAFCSGLVRRMPHISQTGGAPRIAEDPTELYQQAARATLELADDDHFGKAVRALLDHLDVNTTLAANLLAAMLASRDQWLPILRQGGDRDHLEGNLQHAVRHEMRGMHDAMPLGWQDELPALARAACEALHGVAPNPLAELAGWLDGERFDAEPGDLPRWRALAALLLTQKGEPRKSLNKNIGFPPGCAHKQPMQAWLESAGADASWAARLVQATDLPDGCYTEAQWQALTALFACLRLAAAQLQRVFAETGEVDFTEIAQRAVFALGTADDPGDLLLRMDARIRHLLIDEFQDTSQPQIDLLERLTAGWEAGDGRTLFLVGDPMQSIYRFRKAEVGLFLEAAAHGVGGIAMETLTLTDNFRSQAGIVDWVNEKFHLLFPEHDDAEQSAIRYSASRAFKPASDGEAVRFHPIWRDDEDDAPNTLAEAERVVELVRDAIQGNQGDSRDHTVAILVRARSHAHLLTQQLHHAGIAHRAVELVGLAQRPVVADLVQLARALAHPADRLAWLCVLRAPWCGLTLASLATLVGDDHTTPVRELLRERRHLVTGAEDAARLAHAVPILLDADNDSGMLPFAAWVEDTWRRLGGPLAYPSERDQADAESFFCLLEAQAPYGALDPARLNTALRGLFASPDPAPLARNVQIMTMHKSKGLQFDTVILPGLHRRGRADSPPLLRFELSQGRLLAGPIKPQAEADADPISRYLARREARRSAFELDRLLYVAATRAKQRLHLVAELQVDAKTGAAKTPAPSSLLGRLWRVMSDTVPPPPVRATAAPALADQTPAADQARTHTPEPPAFQTGPVLARLPLAALEHLAQNQTDIEATTSERHPRIARAGGGDRVTDHFVERITGELAHAWLEHIAQHEPANWTAARIDACSERIVNQLSRLGIGGSRAERASGVVLETLSATLADDRGRWLLSQAAHREWRLLDHHGRQHVIDLAIESDSGWIIVDYKTSAPHANEGNDAFRARMLNTYASQLDGYCRLVAAATQRPAQAALYVPRAKLWLPVDLLP